MKIYEVCYRRTMNHGTAANDSTSVESDDKTHAVSIVRGQQSRLGAKYGYRASKFSARLLAERERAANELATA